MYLFRCENCGEKSLVVGVGEWSCFIRQCYVDIVLSFTGARTTHLVVCLSVCVYYRKPRRWSQAVSGENYSAQT